MSRDDGGMAEVFDVPDEQQYVVEVDGRRVGVLDYDTSDGTFVALHVEVDRASGGRGLGSLLVSRVLDEVRDSGRRLIPRCPFVSHFLREHPEYADLVDDPRSDEEGGR